MNSIALISNVFAWLAVLIGGWLGWQLLRQNGRILLRIEELQTRLDELEFDEREASGELVSGQSENVAPAAGPKTAENGDHGPDRFTSRSLARSKIKRDGLEAGTAAPDFRLPRLDGHGELALSELRGRRVLLVFSSPGCGPCNTLAPELEKFHREQKRRNGLLSLSLSSTEPVRPLGGEGEASAAAEVVMISKGEPKENRAKVKEHGLTFPVVLQQQWEISRRYAMFATPIAYLINERGAIVEDVAVGTEAILALMAEQVRSLDRPSGRELEPA